MTLFQALKLPFKLLSGIRYNIRRYIHTSIAKIRITHYGKNLRVNGPCKFGSKIKLGNNCNFNGIIILGGGDSRNRG